MLTLDFIITYILFCYLKKLSGAKIQSKVKLVARSLNLRQLSFSQRTHILLPQRISLFVKL